MNRQQRRARDRDQGRDPGRAGPAGVQERFAEAVRHHQAGDRAAARAAYEAVLAEYGDIDIALDPWPFSGGLTSFECLLRGVTRQDDAVGAV